MVATKSPLGVQVIARAAEVLRALEGGEQGLSLGQLSKQLDLPKSTVQRIVAALEREKFVMSATPQPGVRLGPALVRIARSVSYKLTEIAHPTLAALAQRIGETIDLAVLDGAKAVFVDHIEDNQHNLRFVSGIGVSIPLHCSANGKAILASMNKDELQQLKKVLPLKRFTSATICSWPQLEKELDHIRKAGFSTDNEEHTQGVCAIGAAVVGPGGETAALSIPIPAVRFKEKIDEMRSALLDCRNELSEKFSHC